MLLKSIKYRDVILSNPQLARKRRGIRVTGSWHQTVNSIPERGDKGSLNQARTVLSAFTHSSLRPRAIRRTRP
jgi:hypothetical protein